MKYKGPEFLMYAGMLGHTAIVTRKDEKTGKERTYSETYPEWAAKTFRELGDAAVAIYYRTRTARTWGWKPVPYRVAVLDEESPK